MRRAVILAAGLVALLLLALSWHYHPQIVAWAGAMQRDFQNGLARSLRALKSGEGGAWAGLLGLCWGYGFVHAVGPGHGKFLVGAFGAARPVGMGRLAGATIAASLGQALTAVLLVLGGIGLFSMTRRQLTLLAETTLTQFSLISILLIGLWLTFRGARRSAALVGAVLPRPRIAAAGQAHVHMHGHGDRLPCASCGHAHAPSPQAIGTASNWRELASVILAIAVRPCSGAILLLVLTWQMNILAAGIAGAFAMATGTACLTLLVAVLGASLRSGAMAGLAESAALRGVAAGFELMAGTVTAFLAAEGLGLI